MPKVNGKCLNNIFTSFHKFEIAFSSCLLALAFIFQTRESSGVSAFDARLICHRIPGLTSLQRRMCLAQPQLMASVGEGVKLGYLECQRQFRNYRWNCTSIGNPNVFGHVITLGSKEAAYLYAITSAGVTYAITKACRRHNMTTCTCDRSAQTQYSAAEWQWGGCSVNVKHGMRLARKFMDSRELEGDERSMMNLHNNRAGRRAIKYSLQKSCKCHGTSGSCVVKTCWKNLPDFHTVGDYLMKRYKTSKKVGLKKVKRKTLSEKSKSLRIKRRTQLIQLKPKPRDLVYLQDSPTYCEPDEENNIPGTVNRYCNKTSAGLDGCAIMCCGRGYNIHQLRKTWRCDCKFLWCCHVHCRTCTSDVEAYTCK